ncbi:hypothetical protein BBF96_14605 [Anoxybacter fermentans]|uniref:Uncharacterized protein n=1 Tax=Anoxybacter fermentans TaxID=1323375 RepID=A0A3Q9HS90_9FIRM|nr:tetratricopeptide repeat protein [Anoxybacter fermentans]AZR74508.1 hypothetical protein BBF96_14605 [Anoxybacter fermentans]
MDCSNYYEKGYRALKENDCLKGIEYFSKSAVLAELFKEKEYYHLSIRELGRCYFRLGELNHAYDTFMQLFREEVDQEIKFYAISMLAVIDANWGRADKAIEIMKLLPETESVLVNRGLMYYYLYKFHGQKDALVKARLDLERVLEISKSKSRVWKILINLSLIDQEEKEYLEAEKKLMQALDLSVTKREKGMVYNNLGLLYIYMDKLDEAERCLKMALDNFDLEVDLVDIARNDHWRGLLEKKRKNFVLSKSYLYKAAMVLKEKKLFYDLAEVEYVLAEISDDIDKKVDHMVSYMLAEQKAKEVDSDYEEIYKYLINRFDDVHDFEYI